jgi:hypothetical protein
MVTQLEMSSITVKPHGTTKDKTMKKAIISILKNPHTASSARDDRLSENCRMEPAPGSLLQLEGNKPSNIRSSSYAEDVRSLTASTSSSHSLSPIKYEEEAKGTKKMNLVEGSIMKFRKMLSPKHWGKREEMVQEEEKYETHAVPTLSKKDREKHKQFFSQLDLVDGEDDGTTVSSSRTVSNNENKGRESLGHNGEVTQMPSNKSLNNILDDAGVESFPKFLGRIYCGCAGISDDAIHPEDKKKEVKINPVATIVQQY